MKKIVPTVGVATAALIITAVVKKKDSIYDNEPEQKNPMENMRVTFVESDNDKENADGTKGHLEALGETVYEVGFYDKYLKRLIDISLSALGLLVLSPVYLAFTIAIKVDDPGPALFVQKRVGRNKQFFKNCLYRRGSGEINNSLSYISLEL